MWNKHKKYLQECEIIDYLKPNIQNLAKELNANSEIDIAKNCFLYVRDNICHTGDYKDEIGTCKASEVLEYGTGWCYAKALLLAELLRANGIPTALCYQRLSCSEYEEGVYCLHGLNAIYLKEFGWYRVDARGNKEGVNAKFTPPKEQLAFIPQGDEFDIDKLYEKPLGIVVEHLQKYRGYSKMSKSFPDLI